MTNMNAAFVRPPIANQKVNLQELGIYLERVENSDRTLLQTSFAEVFVKEFGASRPSEIAHVSQSLEATIFSKYTDPSSANYKAISKKVLATLKSKADLRA